jgi:hypothetical protein
MRSSSSTLFLEFFSKAKGNKFKLVKFHKNLIYMWTSLKLVKIKHPGVENKSRIPASTYNLKEKEHSKVPARCKHLIWQGAH